MFSKFKIPASQRQFSNPILPSKAFETKAPVSSRPWPKDKGKSPEFFKLMRYHRPGYITGGHRGPSGRQRTNNRRDAWRRTFRG